MKKNNKILFTLLGVLSCFFFFTSFNKAQAVIVCTTDNCSRVTGHESDNCVSVNCAGFSGGCSSGTCCECNTKIEGSNLKNPLGDNIKDIPTFIGIIIKGLLGVVGSLSLIMFIYGGFLWITSGGNEDNIKKGKETLKWAILGIVIVFSSYALLNFVLDIISGTYKTL